MESRALRTADAEIDLRGKMVDEALLELDRFLDSALLGGLETVTIIHGKGRVRCAPQSSSICGPIAALRSSAAVFTAKGRTA